MFAALCHGRRLLCLAVCLLACSTLPLAAAEPVAAEATSISEQERAIRAALDKPVTIEMTKGPLDQVMRKISEAAKIPIEIDRRAFIDAGFHPDVIIELPPHKIPLRSSLTFTLSQLDLAWLIRNDQLLITSKAAAEDVAMYGATRVYDLANMVPPEIHQRLHGTVLELDAESFVNVIGGTIIPDRWTLNGGRNSVRHIIVSSSPMLVAACEPQMHDYIAELLHSLQVSRECQSVPNPIYKDFPGGIPQSLGATAGHPIYAELDRVHDMPARKDVALSELIEQLVKIMGVPHQIDDRGLADAGIDREVKNDFDGGRISGRTALHNLLYPHELQWVVKHDMLVITSRAASQDLSLYGEVRVYPVADLAGVDLNRDPKGRSGDFDSILQAIQGSVAPTTWSDVGGQGPLRAYPPCACIVIAQIQQVHEEIEKLLTDLRKTRAASKPLPVPELPKGLQLHTFTIPVVEPEPASNLPAKAEASKDVRGQLGGGVTYSQSQRRYRTAEEATRVARQLAKVIPQVIAPTTWKTKSGDGQGTIHVVGNTLVVQQEFAVLREIHQLLSKMSLTEESNSGAGGFGGNTTTTGATGGGFFSLERENE